MTKTTVFKSIASDVATAGRALRAHRAQQQPAAGGPLQSYSLDDVLSLVEGGKAQLDAATLDKLRRLLAIAGAGHATEAEPGDKLDAAIGKLQAAVAEVRRSASPAPVAKGAAPEAWPVGDMAPPLPNRSLERAGCARATLDADAVRKLAGDPEQEARAKEEAGAWPIGDMAEEVQRQARLDALAAVLVSLQRKRGG